MDWRASPTAQTFRPAPARSLSSTPLARFTSWYSSTRIHSYWRAERFPDPGVIMQQPYRLDDQVGKIDHALFLEKTFVSGKDFRDLYRPFGFLDRIPIVSGRGEHLFSELPISLGTDQLILCARDRSQHVPQGESRLVQPQVVFQRQRREFFLEQEQGIARICNAHMRIQPEAIAELAQDFQPESMERPGPDRRRRIGSGRRDPLAQLLRRLVGERQDEDRRRIHSLFEQPLDTRDQGPRLAGARTRFDQMRSGFRPGGSLLGIVQRRHPGRRMSGAFDFRHEKSLRQLLVHQPDRNSEPLRDVRGRELLS